MSDIVAVRQDFARSLRDASSRSPSVIEAFARVPRERFLGTGPWTYGIVDERGDVRYERTATSAPAEVYRDSVIALDERRGLNNGQPSSLAHWIDALDLHRGDSVVHVGTGTGYYTAILAELVGVEGAVVGLEIDVELRARARANLAIYGHVTIADEDSTIADASIDALFVNCGVTLPARRWIGWLNRRGKLLVPVTAEAENDLKGLGGMYLASRRGDRFAVRFVSPVGIFSCEGERDETLNRELAAKSRDDWRAPRSLRIDTHARQSSCWLHGADCCISLDDPPPSDVH